jgi:hypothetical protein
MNDEGGRMKPEMLGCAAEGFIQGLEVVKRLAHAEGQPHGKLGSFILSPSSLLNHASFGGLYKLDKLGDFLTLIDGFFDLLKGLRGV